MKNVSILSKIAPVLALLGGAAFLLFYRSNFFESPMLAELDRPQCAHWSILRCCQLLGVPVEMETILEKLPNDSRGHSMEQIDGILHEIGFETEGRSETFEHLRSGLFPRIAHFTKPDHFVVVSAVDDRYVHIFDENGRRTALERAAFENRWSGSSLAVHKPEGAPPLPLFWPLPNQPAPCVQFDSLTCDLGTVPVAGEPIAFAYSFRNVGNESLVIEKIHPGCSCIESQKTEGEIQPGEKGEIKLQYQVQANTGPFFHEIYVQTNDPRVPVFTLTASGWSGVEVLVQPLQVLWNDAVDGNEKTIRCFVKYTGDRRDFQITPEDNDLRGAELVDFKLSPIDEKSLKEIFPELTLPALKYDKIHILELVVKPKGVVGDKISGTITLKTNIAGYEQFVLSVRGTICEPYRIFPEVLSLKEAKQVELMLFSRLEEPWEVKRLHHEGGDVEIPWTFEKTGSKEQTLHFDIPEVDGSVQKLIIEVWCSQTGRQYKIPVGVIP